MAAYSDELLTTARLLTRRRAGQRGRLASARVRRSISTTYYGLFHFILAEVGRLTIGTANDLRSRRRLLGRTITHKALKVALDKVRGARVDVTVQDFMRIGNGAGAVMPPRFAKELALVFSDAQSKRHDADYNLDEPLSTNDADLLRRRVRRVIRDWRNATSATDRDFKKALSALILLKGQLRSDS